MTKDDLPFISRVCMHCGDKGAFLASKKHGSLVDHIYECECGSSWCYITEGETLKRMQFCYP